MKTRLEQVTVDDFGNVIERKVVSVTERVQCEICGETIAEIDRLTIHTPLRGHMFASPDPFHGVEPPFADDLDWEFMRCPHGPHRPFLADDPDNHIILILENNEPLHVYSRTLAEMQPVTEEREEREMEAEEGVEQPSEPVVAENEEAEMLETPPPPPPPPTPPAVTSTLVTIDIPAKQSSITPEMLKRAPGRPPKPIQSRKK